MDTTNASDEEKEAALPAIDFHSPGRFSVRNPDSAAQRPIDLSPADLRLGQLDRLERFEQADQAQSHALALLQQARHQLCLFTPDLEAWLYSNLAAQDACTRLLLASPRNRLRILIRDPGRPVRQGHRLLNLTRRITSNLHIRKVNPDQCDDERAYLLVDDCGLLMREKPAQFAGYAHYNAASRVRQLQSLFDQAWDNSLSDPDLRSFLL